ncbi:MAG: DUF86 domain-containing protein [Burkholderiales bacterium]|nr:DUF86 domain-containing protein [Burkholderiales bacterium]
MHADARKLLWDARHAAERIERFTAGKTFAEHDADEYLRSAVERQFEIVGESMNQLRRIDPDSATAVPELTRVIAFRNILVHGYANVDNRLVWGVVETDLPSLRATLDRLLEKQ